MLREYGRALMATAAMIGLCVGASLIFPAETIQHLLDTASPYAELAYVALFTILPALLVPVLVLVPSAGIAFGFTKACILTIIGIVLNATCMFYLARIGVRHHFERLVLQRLPIKYRHIISCSHQRTLAISFLILRLIPLVSYNLLNYLGGLTNMRYRTYITITLMGTLPGTLIYTNMACHASEITSPAFIISVILILLLIIVPGILGHCREDNRHD